MSISIDGITSLHPYAYDFVMQGFTAGMKDGDFPAYRQAPTEEEIAAIAFDDAGPVGFAIFYPAEDYDRVWLDLIWVAPERRRQSVGTRLLAAVLAYGERHGLAVEFGTLTTNAAMQGLAASFGLEPNVVSYRKEPVAA